MKILIVHNRYLQQGGEDLAVEAEAALLAQRGHTVARHETSNELLVGLGALRMAATSIWNSRARATVSALVAAEQPDVVHFHNTFPWLSPAVYYFRSARRPRVVQTLHNYRSVCAAATLTRNGTSCEVCVGGSALPAVLHACYRQSRAATATVAVSNAIHGALASQTGHVDAFVALSSFARSVFLRGGIPPEKLYVKPNFLADDPGVGPHDGDYVLYAGRLSAEKGITVLLRAWDHAEQSVPLHIIGDGPMRNLVERAAASHKHISYLGPQSRADVIAAMKRARALILPSLAQENSPFVLIEAFATGTPVVCSDSTNLRDLTANGAAAVLFEPDNASALCEAVNLVHDAAIAERIARQGRALFESCYTADRNYEQLLSIYALTPAPELVHG